MHAIWFLKIMSIRHNVKEGSACVCSYSVMSDTLWTYGLPEDPKDQEAPLSMWFFRQEYWYELPFPPPGDLPHSGIESASSALASRFFTTKPPGKPYTWQHLDIFLITTNGRMLLASCEWKPKYCYNAPESSLQQRIIHQKMSIVLRLRNPDLDLNFPILLPKSLTISCMFITKR